MLGPDMEPNDNSTFATLAANLGPLSAQTWDNNHNAQLGIR